MNEKPFGGDEKFRMNSVLAGAERRFITFLTPRIPSWIEGYHLTLMTIPWGAGVITAGYLARNNIHWLWLSNFFILLHWFTDSFDGALGRYRNFGIPKWGFFMDHYLDSVFMTVIFLEYFFLIDTQSLWILCLCMLVFLGFMLNSFLLFAATGNFQITFLGFGPTETRVFFIFVNVVIIAKGMEVVEFSLPFVTIAAFILLMIVVFRTQRYVWNCDMANKDH